MRKEAIFGPLTRFLSLSSTMSSLIMIRRAWNSPSDATWHYDFYDSSASRFHRRIVLFPVFLLSLRYFHDVLRVKFTDRVSISTSTCSSCPSLFFLVIALYNVLHIYSGSRNYDQIVGIIKFTERHDDRLSFFSSVRKSHRIDST